MNNKFYKSKWFDNYLLLCYGIIKHTNYNFFERDNHKIGEMKFISQASDTNIYNHIIAFSVDGKLRLVNFNCTEDLRTEWEEVGDFIINSLSFTDYKD